MKAVGWTQAETARQLCMTSGAVNQIVNPKSTVRPSRTTLQLFKLMVASLRPEAINPQTMELKDKPLEGLALDEMRLLELLRRIAPERRALAIEAATGLLEAFRGKLPPGRRGRRKRG